MKTIPLRKGKRQGQQEESLQEKQLLQLRRMHRMKTILPLRKGKRQGQQEESLQEKQP
jgi:uncharacterized protein YheU (UPF0270 family)